MPRLPIIVFEDLSADHRIADLERQLRDARLLLGAVVLQQNDHTLRVRTTAIMAVGERDELECWNDPGTGDQMFRYKRAGT